MRYRLLDARNPFWRWVGALIILVGLLLTAVYLRRGPKALQPGSPKDVFAGSLKGLHGTLVERLKDGSTFELSYDTLEGDKETMRLEGVQVKVNEDRLRWHLLAPRAVRKSGRYDLEGPLTVEARAPGSGVMLGRGRMDQKGPALRWEDGVWHGLAGMVWEDLEGQGRGVWTIPRGWRRALDGRFSSDQGLVTWVTQGQGTLQKMTAQRMSVLLGMEDAELHDVVSTLSDGEVRTRDVWVDAKEIRWSAPMSFTRLDGWVGSAQGGAAPRPPEGGTLDKIELREFQAARGLGSGEERLHARGARWTPAGLRLEGEVRWETPYGQERVALFAPRMLFRSAPGGGDLPNDLPVGDGWAEGQAVLSWGAKSLSSPRMEARRADRSWIIHGPTHGRAEEGTFSAGRGKGHPGYWAFDGPVQASFLKGGTVRGGKLVWENDVWTLAGRPVTYVGLQERLTGPRLVRQNDDLVFPDGLSGALYSEERDLSVRADRGERKAGVLTLAGRVQCGGGDWRLDADKVHVLLGAGRSPERLEASGHITLSGRRGDGEGERLMLDLKQKKAFWEGRVNGQAEVSR